MGAVKNAMQRDQQDPTIMDLDHEKSLDSQRAAEKDSAGDDGPPLNKDPTYEKYFRMLKMVSARGIVLVHFVIVRSPYALPTYHFSGHSHRWCEECDAT